MRPKQMACRIGYVPLEKAYKSVHYVALIPTPASKNKTPLQNIMDIEANVLKRLETLF
jgi:hypothetical protein